jgi:hypothetical protein
VCLLGSEADIGLHCCDVRFGSKADMCSAKGHVRSTPESRHFVSPIEMLVYPGKLAGAATMGDLHKD